MLGGIWIILRKELVDTLRDRKTLIFMLLMPTLAVPLLMLGLNHLIHSIQEKQAVKVVRIAADQQTHQAYRRLVHQWFLQTKVAAGLRLARSPVLQALLRPETSQALGQIPEAIFRDPAAYERWTRATVGQFREEADLEAKPSPGPIVELSDEVRQQLVDYYRVTVRGLALVEFVDPANLAPAPRDFDAEVIPQELRALPYAAEAAAAIKAKLIQGYLSIPTDLRGLEQEHNQTAEIIFLYDSTMAQSAEAWQRISFVTDRAADNLVRDRLASAGLGDEFLEPVVLKEGTDLATESEFVMSRVGGVLPYIIIIFAFLGGMYPAIDLGAGEKERNTLETLILSPASRTQIAVGKFLVILTTALIAALMGVVSIAVSFRYIIAPDEFVSGLDFHISPGTAVLIALLSIPPAAAFSGMFLAISIYARSFKEAQNYIAPLQFVVILPAMAAIIPDLEMNWRMAMIPLVNVSVLSKDFLKGDIHWDYYAVTLASCLALAGLCIAYAVRQFQKEEVLFRS